MTDLRAGSVTLHPGPRAATLHPVLQAKPSVRVRSHPIVYIEIMLDFTTKYIVDHNMLALGRNASVNIGNKPLFRNVVLVSCLLTGLAACDSHVTER